MPGPSRSDSTDSSLFAAAAGPWFERLLPAAAAFWAPQVLPPSDQVILVDIQATDYRVALRTLTYAQAVRRVVPARLVAFTGVDPVWREQVWPARDTSSMERLARAYGAELVLDYNTLLASLDEPGIEVGGVPLRVPADVETGDWFDRTVLATAARLLFRPRIAPEERNSPEVRRIADRCRAMARANAGILSSWNVVEVVASHVDYGDWGLLVEQALRAGVPVTHVQSTGSVKAYTVYPEARADDRPMRTHVTRAITEQFDDVVLPRRETLRQGAELTAWRSRQNLGRPAWWRGGGLRSAISIRSDAERAAVRRQVCSWFGWDPAKPVVAVFNHAVSDALWTNHEAFADLADWFEQTAAYAAAHPEVNWLLLDHPAGHRYDRSGFFEKIAAQHEGGHVVARPSEWFTKTALWSLTDLVVTVRGSVSNEFPAFGVPALQAGWSEWSGLGFSRVADTPEEYWSALAESIATLRSGGSLIIAEQVERARLWLWLYRSAADVATPLIPPFHLYDPDEISMLVVTAMQQVEVDADPLFSAVRRARLGREPWLTRVDLTDDRLPDLLGTPAAPAPSPERPAGGWLSSRLDPPDGALAVSEGAGSGSHPAIRVLDNVLPGNRIVGRVVASPALVGLRVERPDGRFRIRVNVGVDRESETHWRRSYDGQPPAVRRVEVLALGVSRGIVELPPVGADGTQAVGHLGFAVTPADLGDAEHVVVELRDAPGSDGAVVGLRVNLVAVRAPRQQLDATP